MRPDWARWNYLLVLGIVVGALTFGAFGTISQYADGPAVIRTVEWVAVTAPSPGIVDSVPATPGAHVTRGDILVRFRAADEQAQLPSVQYESDFVRAPATGTVGEVRVKQGQRVAAGELIVSIASEGGFTVIALLPRRYRRSLVEGQSLQLEVAGYQYAYQTLTIERIDDELVGPQDVRRVLGPEVADSLAVNFPVVAVHASLPSTFISGAATYRYVDGMHATARARLGSQRILTSLLPAIKRTSGQSP